MTFEDLHQLISSYRFLSTVYVLRHLTCSTLDNNLPVPLPDWEMYVTRMAR